jgi:acetyl esterase/lipase
MPRLIAVFLALFMAIALICPASTVLATAHDGQPAAPIMPVPRDISPAAQAFYANLRPRPPGPVDIENPKVLAFTRQFLGKMFAANAVELGIEYEFERAASDTVEAYWLRAGEPQTDKVLLYLHGGGQILGSAKTSLVTPLRVALASNLPVLSVEYRLAPEHPFPAGLRDALAAYRWLLANGFEPGDIGVFGDSAGGNLALAMPLLARDEGLPQPAALVLLSPSIDRTRTGDSHATMSAFDPVLGAPTAEVYAIDVALDDPLVSPVYADLHGLPPMLIQVGTRERLLSDSVRLARNARLAGVDVTLDVWDGMWHVWQGNPVIPEAEQATREIGKFFRRHLGIESRL